MKQTIYILITLLLLSCDDMHDFSRTPEWPDVQEPTNLYILCEGLFNMNNSTLARYDLTKKTIDSHYFLTQNKRGLGDTANEMVSYNGMLFIIVSVSSQIEIIDINTGISLKQIPMFNDKNESRQPRHIIIHNNKAYVTCFDGYVLRIDINSLQIDAQCKVGRNPEGLCIANNKLYVANSGGLDYPNYDNTVSVVDLESFTEIKKIQVAQNPGTLKADSQQDVYLSSRGDYSETPYSFQKIDTEIDQVVRTFDNIQALKFIIFNDYAYIYNYDYNTQTSWIKVFDCLKETIIKDNFITDDTKINTPFGININPANGDLYITDAYNYVVWGDVLCFSAEGKLKYKLSEVGLNPNSVAFIEIN